MPTTYGASVTIDELTFRPFTREEQPKALDLLYRAFGDSVSDADREDEMLVLDHRSSHAAFDGDQMVGSLAAYGHDISVPGGEVATAGTTWVAVAPTHRRRGILSRMMGAHLDEAREKGRAIAALWASEAAIYGRFGYGMAVEQHGIDIIAGPGLRWAATAPPQADRIRLLEVDQAADVIAPIYEAARTRRGGMAARDRGWWKFQVLSTRKGAMGGAAWKRVAVAEIDGRDVAYAVYGTSEGQLDGLPDNTLHVIELAGVDAAAEASLWPFLCSHDLVGRVKAKRRPVDDALPLLVEESRRVRRHVSDALYVRILDVEAALTARAWSDSAAVTIEVHDSRFDDIDGTWRIEVAPEGASVQPTTDAPDLRMDIRELGALYLGGVSVSRLVQSGRIEVLEPSVVAPFDSALRPAEAPWAPEVW